MAPKVVPCARPPPTANAIFFSETSGGGAATGCLKGEARFKVLACAGAAKSSLGVSTAVPVEAWLRAVGDGADAGDAEPGA